MAAESTAAQPCGYSDLAAKEALASTAQPLLPADTPDAVRSDLEALLADHARGIHFKRALHEAFDFGFALLDALDLPPLALDVIDDAIATLDALDASDEDREDDEVAEDDGTGEPNLASPERHPEVSRWQWSTPGLYVDRGPESSQLRWAEGAQHDGEVVNEDGDDLDGGEHDESDKEPSIGWPNDFRAVLSPDALQADHDPELVDEDGSEPGHEDEYHPWRFRRPDAVQIAAEACNG